MHLNLPNVVFFLTNPKYVNQWLSTYDVFYCWKYNYNSQHHLLLVLMDTFLIGIQTQSSNLSIMALNFIWKTWFESIVSLIFKFTLIVILDSLSYSSTPNLTKVGSVTYSIGIWTVNPSKWTIIVWLFVSLFKCGGVLQTAKESSGTSQGLSWKT